MDWVVGGWCAVQANDSGMCECVLLMLVVHLIYSEVPKIPLPNGLNYSNNDKIYQFRTLKKKTPKKLYIQNLH